MADEVLVKSILIYGLYVGVFVSWLGIAGFLFVAQRRLGSGGSRELKLWTRLKILEYAWLPLFMSLMFLGLRGWVVLPMAIVWVALVAVSWVIGRRVPPWPTQPDPTGTG
jgi:hypothetical protein